MAVDSTFDVTPVGLISARKEGYRLGSASSAQPDMVSAGITDKGRLRLTAGGSPGRATVRMNMKKGGKTISNALTFHTAEVSNASVESSCPQAKAYGGPVRYLAGSTVEFDYSMQGPDGKNLHGHGIYPLDIEGARLAETQETGKLRAIVDPTAKRVKIESKLSDSTVDGPIVGKAKIDKLEWTERAWKGANVEDTEQIARILGLAVGETIGGQPLAFSDGVPICQGVPDVEIQNSTPQTCAVEMTNSIIQPVGGQVRRSSRGLKVSGKQVGQCKFEVSVKDTPNSPTLEFSAEVKESLEGITLDG